MYPKYFGLREPSFSITPDPQYLFLSEQHREALAHLLYGAGEGGGFVLLTGEVGTGKTTVCRAFLEQLPAEVDVALILNPAVSAIELLRAVCDEFRIQVPENERTSKQLVDRINAFLLTAHANGRRPVLMIDEAQNLRPKVLEQIRLLTNLETPKQKLLQIFLVGQPELRILLSRQGLRQLDQRITARFHLKPLDARETGDYIRHRLAVAGVERPLFTPPAVRRIHALSGGVPRLVNILCDRALLGACVSRAIQVTPKIVDKSAWEVRGEVNVAQKRRTPSLTLVLAGVVLALAVGWLARGWLEGGGAHPLSGLSGWWPPEVPEPVTVAPEAAPTPITSEVRIAVPEPDAVRTESPGHVEGDAAATTPTTKVALSELPAETTPPPTPAVMVTALPAGSSATATAVAPGVAVAVPPVAAVPAGPLGPLTPGSQGVLPVVPGAVPPPGPQVPAVAAPITPAAPAGGPAPTPAAAPAGVPPAVLPASRAETLASPTAPVPSTPSPVAPSVPLDPRQMALAEPEAMRLLLSHWGLNLKDLPAGDTCEGLPAYGLRCERDRGGWRPLRALDLPAMLRLRQGKGRAQSYVVLVGMDAETITLAHPDGNVRLPRAEVNPLLSGYYTLVWQPPPMGTASIGAGSSGESVRWLRKLLSQVPESGVTDTESGAFDAAVAAALRRFQVKYGLNPDGIAGPKTLIQLNNAVGMPGIPKLSRGG